MSSLELWTVYDHPSDAPNHYVARRFLIDQPTNHLAISRDLESLRRAFRDRGMVPLARDPRDDPVILETWL